MGCSMLGTRLGHIPDADVMGGALRTDCTLQPTGIIQKLEVPAIAYNNLPCWRHACIIEAPVRQSSQYVTPLPTNCIYWRSQSYMAH